MRTGALGFSKSANFSGESLHSSSSDFGKVTFKRAVPLKLLCQNLARWSESSPHLLAGGFVFIAYPDLETQPQLPGWVGVCEFKGTLSHWAFVLSGPVCPGLSDTNFSKCFRKSPRKQLGFFASSRAILGGKRGGHCVWHRSVNWENGKLWLLPTGVDVKPKDRWAKINVDVKVGLHMPFCLSSFHS